MMNLKNYLLFGFVLLSISAIAQADFGVLNAQTPDEIGQVPEQYQEASKDSPIPYGYVNERDILWSKIVWEEIDLNERMNMPLYYPIDSANVNSSRKSLFYTLLKGIKTGKIKEVYDDSFFKSKLTEKDINQKLTRVDTSDYAYELINEGETDIKDFVDEISIKSEDISGYKIKGIWYFDKRHGELKYRLLAIAPLAPDVQLLGRDDIIDDETLPLFWIFYPDAREVLHNAFAFNNVNHRSPISFDDLLNSRRFTSFIIREENLYGNRAIADYIQGNALYQIMESERIREQIRNKELDMWNY
ncbi:gliding motility protein GldN [Flavicella sp.]|uniref:type IX secretion system ring protein PorN/GldN n=1 Tax=Flavicella sp. TaxID=2957742 RepID=UPI00343AE12D